MGASESSPGGAAAAQPRRNVSVIDRRLQERLARGVDLNVKVVVRGQRGSGKSALLARLRGLKAGDSQGPTREIAVSHVHWRNTVDEAVVKVEAWDVVDEALELDPQEAAADPDAPLGLPPTEAMRLSRHGSHTFELLDARVVDVYREADAVWVLYDPRSRASFEHASRLARESPPGLPLVLLRSKSDLWADSPARALPAPQAAGEALAAELCGPGPVPVRAVHHLACSSLTSEGLGVLYTYLQVPVLSARRRQLAELQRRNDEQLVAAVAAVEALLRGEARPPGSFVAAVAVQAAQAAQAVQAQQAEPRAQAPRDVGDAQRTASAMGVGLEAATVGLKAARRGAAQLPFEQALPLPAVKSDEMAALDAFFADEDEDEEAKTKRKLRGKVASSLLEPVR
jgi:GTPase SAR1 family protein